jgi:hypothetical protein
MPADKTIFHDMFALMKRYNPLYTAVDEGLSDEQLMADTACGLNINFMGLTKSAFKEGQRLNIIDGYLNRL